MSKLPAIQFYPGDWRKDPGVQALSYEERGIWLEFLMLMHESESRGILLLAGKPITDDRLAQILHLDKQKITDTISTLLELGVASRCTDTGALMNRRMVRDEVLREKRSGSGRLGGNPNFESGAPNPYYGKDKQKDNQEDNHHDKQKITPSSSSSSSSSSSNKEQEPPIVPQGTKQASALVTRIRSDFKDFWAVVWNKTGIDVAFRAYEKRRNQGIPHEVIKQAAINQREYLLQNDRPIHPATWLNAGRFMDEPSAYQARGSLPEKKPYLAEFDRRMLERVRGEVG